MPTLTDPKKIEIELSAKDLLADYYSSLTDITLPINLEPILEKFELSVSSVQFKDPNISGAYDKDKMTIYVSKDVSYPKKAFIIAHELAHFILHRNKGNEFFYRNDLAIIPDETLEEESEANLFAAILLMPENLVRKYWTLANDVDKLAVIFGVPASAIYFRLKTLGLLT